MERNESPENLSFARFHYQHSNRHHLCQQVNERKVTAFRGKSSVRNQIVFHVDCMTNIPFPKR
jgi:hypothetical protein